MISTSIEMKRNEMHICDLPEISQIVQFGFGVCACVCVEHRKSISQKHKNANKYLVRTKKDLLGKAVERTPKIEQVNLNGGRLLREAKVCS